MEFSVFVGNLPVRLDYFGLKGVFLKAGHVCDTYIPFKRSGKGRFGFVRFRKEEEARKSIQLMHNAVIRGSRLFVTWARPRRSNKRLEDHGRQRTVHVGRLVPRKVWREKGEAVGHKRTTSQGSQQFMAKITGEVNEEIEDWLERSLVCTTEEPRDLGSLASAIFEGCGPSCTVRALSAFKFLLTYPTVEEMKGALSNQDELLVWFLDVKQWATDDFCDSR